MGVAFQKGLKKVPEHKPLVYLARIAGVLRRGLYLAFITARIDAAPGTGLHY
jgi:hypothetical protein